MTAEQHAVGLIGLGAMGSPIARRLMRSGLDVVVYDRMPEAVHRLAKEGAVAAESPIDVALSVPVVITSLPGAAELRAVVGGDDGVFAAGTATTIVDTSTFAPSEARELAGEARAVGAAFLDAPVSGGPVGAQAGELVIMVGGDGDVLATARPLLEPLGTVFHCGAVGAGQMCKACNQLMVVGTLELVAEVLALATASGLDGALVRAALLGGYAQSRVLDLHGDRMLRRDFVPGGKARFNLKDAQAVRGLAAAAGLELPGFEAAARQIERLVAEGGGDLDNSALITVVERSAERAR